MHCALTHFCSSRDAAQKVLLRQSIYMSHTAKPPAQIAPNPKTQMFIVSSCRCLCQIQRNYVLSWEWMTGDAPTTSEWSTILLPIKVRIYFRESSLLHSTDLHQMNLLLNVGSHKGPYWDHYSFYCILMIWSMHQLYCFHCYLQMTQMYLLLAKIYRTLWNLWILSLKTW